MRSNQLGMSLVELLLAQALGLFLIFGLITVYLTVQKTFRLQQSIVSTQENGRFAAHFLNESIRMAGFAHCAPADTWVDQDAAIRGYGGNVPDFLRDIVKKDTDSLEVGECAIRDQTEQFERFAFFIGPTGRTDPSGKDINALYVKYRKEGNKRELVSGIDDMKIRYGVVNDANDRDIANYLTAEKVVDWNKVRAVEIALSLSADRFLHRQWYVYVALRELNL